MKNSHTKKKHGRKKAPSLDNIAGPSERKLESGSGGRKGHHRGVSEKRNHGRGSKRILKRGDLKWLLLNLIAKSPRNGYDLMLAIEKRSQGYYKPSPGVTYPALEMLRDMEWVKTDEKSGKKIFNISDAGQKALDGEAKRLSIIEERLEKISSGQNKGGNSIKGELNRLIHAMRKLDMSDQSTRETTIATLRKATTDIEVLIK